MRIDFTGSQGHRLAGRLDLPDDREPVTHAVLAHCFTCGKDSRAAARIARGLVAKGLGVLRFDVTGLGESEGDFAATTFSSDVADLVAAVEFLEADGRPVRLLIGHSLGGAAAIAAAGRLPGIRAVVTIAAPCSPDHLLTHFGDAVGAVERDGVAEVTLAGRAFSVRRAFLDDIAEQPQARRLRDLGRPLLVLHSPEDDVVPIEEAQRIFRAARHPRSFVALDGADHLLSAPSTADYAASVIAAWAAPYLRE